MYFTKEDYRQIENYFKLNAWKDTDFLQIATNAINDDAIIALVLEGVNYRTTIGNLKNFIGFTPATSETLGTVKTGYVSSGNNYGLKVDGAGNAYTTIPLQDFQLTCIDNDGEPYSIDQIDLFGSNITTSVEQEEGHTSVFLEVNVADDEHPGLMSTSMYTKLNGIAPNANNYQLPTASELNLGGIKVRQSAITSAEELVNYTDYFRTYADYLVLRKATTHNDGAMSKEDKAKIDSLPSSYLTIDVGNVDNISKAAKDAIYYNFKTYGNFSKLLVRFEEDSIYHYGIIRSFSFNADIESPDTVYMIVEVAYNNNGTTATKTISLISDDPDDVQKTYSQIYDDFNLSNIISYPN